MAEMAVILYGLMAGTYGIQWRKHCKLPGWMKYSTYYSATAGIRSSAFQHSITTTMGK